MAKGEDGFVAAVALIFGVLAWAQMPALCGFMFSSTLAGAGNFIYSVWLGGLIALIGLVSAIGPFVRGGRNPMLLVGAALSIAFIVCALVAPVPYAAACKAVFEELSPT
jgi:hypothetical protein